MLYIWAHVWLHFPPESVSHRRVALCTAATESTMRSTAAVLMVLFWLPEDKTWWQHTCNLFFTNWVLGKQGKKVKLLSCSMFTFTKFGMEWTHIVLFSQQELPPLGKRSTEIRFYCIVWHGIFMMSCHCWAIFSSICSFFLHVRCPCKILHISKKPSYLSWFTGQRSRLCTTRTVSEHSPGYILHLFLFLTFLDLYWELSL